MAGRSDVSLKKTARHGESGNTTVKFLLVAVMLFAVGHGGYNYLMAWYQSTQFRDAMQETITTAYAMPYGQASMPENMKLKLRRIADENNIPAEAVIKVEKGNNGITAQASYTRPVPILPFNLYNYKYEFNHTATPPNMMK